MLSASPSIAPLPSGFVMPSFNAPVDLAARIAHVSPTSTMKGLFFIDLVDELRRHKISLPHRARYVQFSDYPMTEWLQLLSAAAMRLHPNVPFGEALRRMGRRVYLAFSSTLVGRVLFSTVNDDFGELLALSAKAWRLADPQCSFDLKRTGEHSVYIEFRRNYIFPDLYHVGICEGAAAAYGLSSQIRIRVHSLSDMDAHISWRRMDHARS